MLSVAEQGYVAASLALQPPVRPDGRDALQYRPLSVQTDVLDSAYGSARVTWADADVLVGVKAHVDDAPQITTLVSL